MANSIYQINKGINKSIEFKGLKAQYVWYFAAGVMGLLFLFGIMYLIGLNNYVCIVIIMIAGTAMTMKVYQLSNTYGEHGMMKKMAKRMVPKVIKTYDRSMFLSKKDQPLNSGREERK